jgi:hypothetical protein
MVVRLVFDHFRSHVLQCSAESVALFVKLLLNAPSEVANLEHVFFSHQKILRFEVSVNDVGRVEILETD